MAEHDTSELHPVDERRTPEDDAYRARWLRGLLLTYVLGFVAVGVLAWLGVRP